MSRLFTLRTLLALAAVSAVALVGSSGALATTSTGNQNPELLATASLVSSGADPNVASAGDFVSARVSVKNISDHRQWVRVLFDGSFPSGSLPDLSGLVMVPAGRSVGLALPLPIFQWTPSGVYTISIGGLGDASLDPSRASASITIANG